MDYLFIDRNAKMPRETTVIKETSANGVLLAVINDEIIDLLILLLLFSSEKALETVNNGSAPVVINTQKQPDTDKSQKERGGN
jgi:hypothetical protein